MLVGPPGIPTGFTERMALGNGYFFDLMPATIGQFAQPGPGGGNGDIRTIDLGDPAAGADYTDQTVPTDALWLPRGFSGRLSCDGNAANRWVALRYTNGSGVVFGGTAIGSTITANEAKRPVGGIASSFAPTTDATTYDEEIAFPMPETYLSEGDIFEVNTQNIQVGDNWEQGLLQVEEWIVV